jgi:hypothetical protein
MFGFGNTLFNVSRTPPAPPVSNTLYTGCNVVSLESVTYNQYDPLSGPPTGNYPIHSDALLNWLYAQGVRQARVTFSMEAITGSAITNSLRYSAGGGADPTGLYLAYWNALVSLTNRLIALGIRVIVEPWQYSNVTFDTNVCYQGAIFTSADFQTWWQNFTSAFVAATTSSSMLAFGLMNEPHSGAVTGGGSVASWYSIAQGGISGIRAAGVTNRIYVSGWSYADCGAFVSNGSAAQHLLLTDSANNLAVEVHNYNGQLTTTGNRSTTTALQDYMAAIVSWSRANGNILINVGELAIDAGAPNGTSAVATAQWADWQAYCVANKDIITGWEWWAVSENGWWSTSDSSGGFNWGLTNGSNTTASVYMNLIQTSLGAF